MSRPRRHPPAAPTSALTSMQRARPLLGTLVEIRITARPGAAAERALAAAFAAVSRVHACMSPQAAASDLQALARARVGATVAVEPWTWSVLAAAHRWSLCSDGIFDATAGRGRAGDWTAVCLHPGNRVVLRRRVIIDLGGIAKGFAVDRAVDALQACGVRLGTVNAGGDLRTFGPQAEGVFVRDPWVPGRLVPAGRLQDGAFATSSNSLDKPGRGRLLRPDGGRLWIGRGSVSVRAATCMDADALCKIVAAIGPVRAQALLVQAGAEAFILTRNARLAGTPFVHAA